LDEFDYSTKHQLIFNYTELIFYAGLGVICGFGALLFMKTLYWFEDFFEEKVKMPKMLKPALGGLLLGLLAVMLPHGEIMGKFDSSVAAWLESIEAPKEAVQFFKPSGACR